MLGGFVDGNIFEGILGETGDYIPLLKTQKTKKEKKERKAILMGTYSYSVNGEYPQMVMNGRNERSKTVTNAVKGVNLTSPSYLFNILFKILIRVATHFSRHVPISRHEAKNNQLQIELVSSGSSPSFPV